MIKENFDCFLANIYKRTKVLPSLNIQMRERLRFLTQSLPIFCNYSTPSRSKQLQLPER